MEPSAKRRRLAEAESSFEASHCHRDYNQESNGFEGQGLQNRGNLNIGRDVTIQNFGNQSKENREDDKYQILLDSLRFDQMDDRQLSIKAAYARTCEWFLETPAYANWTLRNTSHNSHNFLWIRGKPGAGKSTLMKFVLRRLRSQIRRAKSQEVLLSFFFNARGHELEKTTAGLYRSLLLQLLEARPDLQYVLEDIRVGHHWTTESLKSVFEEAAQAIDDTPVVCLVDALDECDDAQVQDMVSFLSGLGMARSRLRICFASRHYPHITVETGLNIVLENELGHSSDIASYLSTALRIGHNKSSEQIRSDLQEKASGVFMWVVLVTDILNEEYDAGRVHILRKRIQQLPKDLHELFHSILKRDGNSMHSLLLCIQWVLFARQPLTPKQLYFAILSGVEPHSLAHCHSDGISEDDIKRYILHNSKGLAELTKTNSPTVQFIHESVRDFLLKDDGLSKIWPHLSTNLAGRSHDALKQCCLAYTNMIVATDIRRPRDELTTQLPFLKYASQGILYHAENAQTGGISQQTFLALFPRSRWVQCHNILEKTSIRQYTTYVSLLYILAEANMPALIRAHVNRQPCFQIENERYGVPILAASATKCRAAIQAMLELQAERVPGISFADFCCQLPPDLDIECASTRAFSFDRQRMLPCQLIEHGNERVSLSFFITEQYDIHVRDDSGETLLLQAIRKGFITLARLLIDRGVDISSADKRGQTPLHKALILGHTDIAQLLINSGASISPADIDGRTPLHEVSVYGYTDIARLLINRGADISPTSMMGQTPLHKASICGQIEMARLLINSGADISPTDKMGQTPLHGAALKGYIDLVQLLINYGADIPSIDNDGHTPWDLALVNGHTEVTKLLTDRGAMGYKFSADTLAVRYRYG